MRDSFVFQSEDKFLQISSCERNLFRVKVVLSLVEVGSLGLSLKLAAWEGPEKKRKPFIFWSLNLNTFLYICMRGSGSFSELLIT